MQLIDGIAHVTDLDSFLGDLDEIATETDCTVQAFDARYVVDATHLRRAVELADRAFERGENVARDRGVEIMLYAAGRRQIDRALELGVSEGEMPVVVLVVADGGDDDGQNGDGGDDAHVDEDDEMGRESRAAERVRPFLTPDETLGESDD